MEIQQEEVKRMKRAENILLDYKDALLVVNGKKINDPVKITIQEPDGYNLSKLFNSENYKPGDKLPEITINMSNFLQLQETKEIEKIIRDLIERILGN
jgi:hypothetical protein